VSSRASLLRKVVYLAMMAALLLPLSFLSQPAATGASAGRAIPGGILARMRESAGLSQTNLGEIDPASEAMRLSLLGMRGIAANLLWKKADDYKMKKDWTNLRATLDQLTYLEPHFVPVWRYQGWNLSYNVSVEWDDYRDRYYWVKQGVEFLDQGTIVNGKDTRLLTDQADTLSRKIGRADESRQFRRMFRADRDFRSRLNLQSTDNWLAGRERHLEAEDMVKQGLPIKGATTLVFYSNAPLCRIHYADALERDGGADGRGVFGEVARNAWRQALADWEAYGARDILATTGETIRLGELDSVMARFKKGMEDLDALAPGVREQVIAEKTALLSPEEREILLGPLPTPDSEAGRLLQGIKARVTCDLFEIADRVQGENRAKAQELAKTTTALVRSYERIVSSHGIVNYPHWTLRCTYEADPDTVKARELVAEGDRAYFVEANMPKAKELYTQGISQWRLVFDRYDLLNADRDQVATTMDFIERYQMILRDLGEELPADFVLQDVIDLVNRNPGLRN
jgi:hypothetical protein